jgi:hypothetical protein
MYLVKKSFDRFKVGEILTKAVYPEGDIKLVSTTSGEKCRLTPEQWQAIQDAKFVHQVR